jgi:hypothetical protein
MITIYAHQNGMWLNMGNVRKQYQVDDIIKLKNSQYPLKVLDVISDKNETSIYTMFMNPYERLMVTDIQWDSDDENLPDEIQLPIGIVEDEKISDYISDVTGFCHNGFVINGRTYEYVLNTQWYQTADTVDITDADGDDIDLPDYKLLNARVIDVYKEVGFISLVLEV